MKLKNPEPVSSLAKLVNGDVEGDPAIMVHGLADIDRATEGDLVFADSQRYLRKALVGASAAVMVPRTVDSRAIANSGKTFVLVEHPHLAYWQLTGLMFGDVAHRGVAQVHPTAIIADTATIGHNCRIGPYCVIGERVVCGDGSVLDAHVVVEDDCRIGQNCRIRPLSSLHYGSVLGDDVIVGSGSRIGSDAFYFFRHDENLVRGRSIGTVELRNAVELGAGCTIDRGISGATLIGSWSKLDDQVHIGHDVIVGERVLITAQVGLSGFVRIGDDVTIRGQVGVMQRVTIGSRAQIQAMSGVDQDVAASETVFGVPALPMDRYIQRRRSVVKRVRALERSLLIGPHDAKDFQEKVFQAIAGEAGLRFDEISLDQDLGTDLGLDSLDRIAVRSALEDELAQELLVLELHDREFESVRTVRDVVELARKSLKVRRETD